uniref:Uncharacterized protein n=1 Tax=Anguilla anguilla TaxID=7936 RepID=A0A0E9TE90_ANGAN
MKNTIHGYKHRYFKDYQKDKTVCIISEGFTEKCKPLVSLKNRVARLDFYTLLF